MSRYKCGAYATEQLVLREWYKCEGLDLTSPTAKAMGTGSTECKHEGVRIPSIALTNTDTQ